MRIGTRHSYLAPLVILLVAAVGGCAAPAATGSAGTTSAVSAINSAITSAPAPSSVGPAASAIGTEAVIPSAPGTVGSAAVPTQTAPVVSSAAGDPATPLPQCTPTSLATRTAGTITFAAAGSSAPWFQGAPAQGQGFEPALARAVATTLGFNPDHISWTSAPRAAVTAGTATGFDVALGELATPDDNAPVDYSTGYFPIAQAVVVRTATSAATVTEVAGLKTLRLGAVSGSAGLRAAQTITPGRATTAFGSRAPALTALRAGTVDAVILDLPTAVTAGSGLTVLGQLPTGSEQPQQFGMVLAKGSALTGCVSAAIDLLRVNGTLAGLQQQWLPAGAITVLR